MRTNNNEIISYKRFHFSSRYFMFQSVSHLHFSWFIKYRLIFFKKEYWLLLVLWSWFLSEKQIMKFKSKYMKLIWAKTHINVRECVPKSSKHTISALRWLIIIMIVCFSSREKRATPKLNLLRHCSNIIPYVNFELYHRSS